MNASSSLVEEICIINTSIRAEWSMKSIRKCCHNDVLIFPSSRCAFKNAITIEIERIFFSNAVDSMCRMFPNIFLFNDKFCRIMIKRKTIHRDVVSSRLQWCFRIIYFENIFSWFYYLFCEQIHFLCVNVCCSLPLPKQWTDPILGTWSNRLGCFSMLFLF